jgi:hypothetical protein
MDPNVALVIVLGVVVLLFNLAIERVDRTTRGRRSRTGLQL